MRDHLNTIRKDPLLLVLWLALICFAVIWIAPFAFIVFTSLKGNGEIMSTGPFALPTELRPDNYDVAWNRGGFSRSFFNSVFVSAVKVPLGIALSAIAAYALAKMPGRFNRLVFLLIVFGTMIPFQVMLAPIFTLVNKMGLVDSYAGLILPYLAFGVPFQVFILHSFFRGVPKELSEAALIDGAGHFTIFRRIFLPISLPILAALFILDFVATWNEFAMALVIMQDQSKWTLPLGLMSFQGQFSNEYGQLNAAIVITVLPAVLVYLIFQRYFVSGLAAGAVKG
ncbi:carbohydrate ABC transporter permease [Roseibium suaedae]|uniref:sn-glycerol-3-phosphate transport system permease protein UgpE n=1 Tax=Roseibium suaedae TaxID=735517 RepID=A0A1M7F269_9HYPH|nr:carbohydrate ABC transporter permease [Roseibium suaedae]SHL97769.1 carbohydrate ABC transporter membrane protein 2, CUT1 family [Roseibium suaedae]